MKNECNICQSPTIELGQKIILKKYSVIYLKCTSCDHIQSERPYWVQEAYANLSFKRDTGMASRSIASSQMTTALAYYFKFSDQDVCVDEGAGTGLHVRLSRDNGLNMFYKDPYSKNIFADGFEYNEDIHKEVKLVTAYEVLEHLINPLEELKIILKSNPDFFLASTCLSDEKDIDWWYILPDGQHVNLYSQKSLQLLAKSCNYNLTSDSDLHIFSKRDIPFKILKKIRTQKMAYSLKFQKCHSGKTVSDMNLLFPDF